MIGSSESKAKQNSAIRTFRFMHVADTSRRGKPASQHASQFARESVWLFPITYLAHIAEEYWAGEGFPAWVSRIADVELTPNRFLGLNGIAWVLMCVGSLLVLKSASMRWLSVTFGTVVLLNGLLHLAASMVTVSYSPGSFTGLLLWAPLGAVTLLRAWTSTTRRTFRAGVIVGLAIHAVVSLLALYADRIMS